MSSRVSTKAGLRLLEGMSKKMTYANLRCWLEKKLVRVSPKALEFHLAILDRDALVRMEEGRREFKRLLRSDRDCQAVLKKAGFEEGSGYDYERNPDWAIEVHSLQNLPTENAWYCVGTKVQKGYRQFSQHTGCASVSELQQPRPL